MSSEPALARRLGMLTRHPAFDSLWLARVVSFLGETIASVALLLYAARQEDGGTAVGRLLLAQTLPRGRAAGGEGEP